MRRNEQVLCGAMVRLLEERTGSARRDIEFPEHDSSGPPVEVRFRLGARGYAIEHTLIEPFTDAIRSGKEFAEFIAEIEAELNGKMPSPGVYQVVFPVHPTAGRHRRTHKELRERIIAFIWETGVKLHSECPERPDRNHRPNGHKGTQSTEIDGIRLTISREVHWSGNDRHDGKLILMRAVGDNVEDLRRERIGTALDNKLGKLAACRALGDVTILILEYSDISLTNHIFVAEPLEAALDGRDNWPDHIYLADTQIEGGQWHFFHVVDCGVVSEELEYIDIPLDWLTTLDQ